MPNRICEQMDINKVKGLIPNDSDGVSAREKMLAMDRWGVYLLPFAQGFQIPSISRLSPSDRPANDLERFRPIQSGSVNVDSTSGLGSHHTQMNRDRMSLKPVFVAINLPAHGLFVVAVWCFNGVAPWHCRRQRDRRPGHDCLKYANRSLPEFDVGRLELGGFSLQCGHVAQLPQRFDA
jgi:hypothetical protein